MNHLIQNSIHDAKRGLDYIGVCCVFFCHDGNGRFLLNKRSDKCRDEVGAWDPGGGALEFGETPEEAAKREIMEEYCSEVIDLKFAGARNVLRTNGNIPTHWISLVFIALIKPDQVANGDPEKIDEIGWFSPDTFPDPLHSQFVAGYELIKNTSLLN